MRATKIEAKSSRVLKNFGGLIILANKLLTEWLFQQLICHNFKGQTLDLVNNSVSGKI